jgi:RpiR family carbohydrate utilization transcriptional regulator
MLLRLISACACAPTRSSRLQPGGFVVAIPHTGRTKDIFESVMTARDGGAELIAITSPDSPLALAASLALPVDTSEDTDLFMPMISRLAHLAVVDVLATGTALRRGRVVDENLHRLGPPANQAAAEEQWHRRLARGLALA